MEIKETRWICGKSVNSAKWVLCFPLGTHSVGITQTVSENEINNGITLTNSENGGSEENRHSFFIFKPRKVKLNEHSLQN